MTSAETNAVLGEYIPDILLLDLNFITATFICLA
jgi:hypothetical protein